MANQSAFATNPVIGVALLAAAIGGTRIVPTTGLTVLATGAALGTLISRVNFMNQAAVAGDPAANCVAFYLRSGGVAYLYKEYTIDPVTSGAATASTLYEFPFNDLVLPSGVTLEVGIRTYGSAVDTTAVQAFGADIIA